MSLIALLFPAMYAWLLILSYHLFSFPPSLPCLLCPTVCFSALSPTGCPTASWEPPQSPNTQSEKRGAAKREKQRENKGWEVIEERRRRRRRRRSREESCKASREWKTDKARERLKKMENIKKRSQIMGGESVSGERDRKIGGEKRQERG